MISTRIRFKPFVGRDSELGFLLQEAANASRCEGRVVLIVGQAGIGKTRLVQEFQAAVNATHRFVFGACLDYARGALAPFLQILTPSSGNVWNLDIDRQDLRADPACRARRVFDSILLGLRDLASAGTPVVVVIEDIHWADDATLHMLEYLSRNIPALPLCVLVSCRDDVLQGGGPVAATLSTLIRNGADLLHLEPLKPGDVRFLTRAAFKRCERIPTELRDRIEKLAAGNPLYLEELLRETMDQATNGVPRLRHIPSSLEATTLERFDRLSDQVRETLRKAAVLGDQFDVHLLATVSGSSVMDINYALQMAVDSHFIEESDSGDYRFCHALIREVLYSTLTRASAAAVHALAAEALELQCGPGEKIPERAYHWSVASIGPMALRYNEQAGSEAMAMGMYRDAARFFHRALKFSSANTLQRAKLNEQLATALFGDDAMDEAKGYFFEAINGYISSGSIRYAAQPIELLYAAYYYDGDIEGGLKFTSWIRELAARNNEQIVVDELLIGVAAFFSNNGMGNECDDVLQLLATEQVALSSSFRIQLHELRGVCHIRHGAFQAAMTELEAALEVAKRANKHQLVPEILCNLGAIHRIMGDLRTGENLTLDALGVSEQYPPPLAEWCLYTLQYTDILYLRGKLREAEQILQRALAFGAECETARVRSTALGIQIALTMGRDRLLARCADETVIDLAFASHKEFDIAWVADAFAKLYIYRGQMHDAEDILRRGIGSIHESHFSLDMLMTVGKYGRPEDVSEARRHIANICSYSSADIGETYAAYFGAIVARRERNWPDRRRLAAIAVAGFKRLGMALHHAEALELAGLQKAALSIYSRVGAAAETRRLERIFVDRGHRGGLLTRRQTEIANLLVSNLSNRELAQRLDISEKTLENHISSIYRRLGSGSRDAIVSYLAGHAE